MMHTTSSCNASLIVSSVDDGDGDGDGASSILKGDYNILQSGCDRNLLPAALRSQACRPDLHRDEPEGEMDPDEQMGWGVGGCEKEMKKEHKIKII